MKKKKEKRRVGHINSSGTVKIHCSLKSAKSCMSDPFSLVSLAMKRATQAFPKQGLSLFKLLIQRI